MVIDNLETVVDNQLFLVGLVSRASPQAGSGHLVWTWWGLKYSVYLVKWEIAL